MYDTDFDYNDDGNPDFLALLGHSFQPNVAVYSLRSLPFTADRPVLSTTNSETQQQSLNAGVAHAGAPYVVLGTVSGTKPGVRIGSVHVPLNLDGYTSFTLAFPNSPILPGSVGVLDAKGQAKARFQAFPPSACFAPGLRALRARVCRLRKKRPVICQQTRRC